MQNVTIELSFIGRIRRKVIEITLQQKIAMALAHEGMTQAELARRFGSTPPAFKQRLNNGKFTQEELEKIASVLNAEYFSGFKFNDGTVIE